MWVESVGYLAGFFIVISFIPQVLKSYKTKSVEDVSLGLVVLTFVGTVLWLAYGLLIKDNPLIFVNVVFGVIVLVELYLKIKYEKH